MCIIELHVTVNSVSILSVARTQRLLGRIYVVGNNEELIPVDRRTDGPDEADT
jgi:hypothetical protein